MSFKGKFITFEGSEGCGKSTQIQLMDQFLTEQKIKHIVTREPGGTKLAEQLRNIVKYCDYENINISTEVLLFSAARSQHFHNIIKPHLQDGYIVLCDRFIDSTFIYQGYCQGVNMFMLNTIMKFIDENIFPNLTIYLDVPVNISIERIQKRNLSNKEFDRFETRGEEFFKQVKRGFEQYLIPKYPDRIIKINGNKDFRNVHEEIKKTIQTKFKGVF